MISLPLAVSLIVIELPSAPASKLIIVSAFATIFINIFARILLPSAFLDTSTFTPTVFPTNSKLEDLFIETFPMSPLMSSFTLAFTLVRETFLTSAFFPTTTLAFGADTVKVFPFALSIHVFGAILRIAIFLNTPPLLATSTFGASTIKSLFV